MLTLRYVMALGLIFCVLLGSYSVLQRQIVLNKQDAYIVNISGMQRMLSQRISLLMIETYHAGSEEAANVDAQNLRPLSDKMEDNLRQLSSGMLSNNRSYKLSAEIDEMYHGKNGLKPRIQDYLREVRAFLDVFDRGGVEALRARYDIGTLSDIGDNGALLKDLDAAVSRYQFEAEEKIKRFSKTETLVLLLGVLVLIAEAFLIFRPMVREIGKTFEALQKANGELVEFSYRVFHDLRAPAVSSKGLIELARDALKKGDTAFVKTALGHVYVSMDRLEVLVDDILNLTKMKMIDGEVNEFELLPMVEAIEGKVGHIENAHKVEFRIDVDFDNPLKLKEFFLEQSLENLISNAIKYMDVSKKTPFVSVSARITDDVCEIIVADNGIGIPKDYRDQVFEMFKRFHPTVASGSGLGLYLVQQNMQALDGQVVYTPLPDGSEFKLIFPVNI